MITEDPLEHEALTPALSHGEKEEDGRLAEVLRTLTPTLSQGEKEKDWRLKKSINPIAN